MTNFNQHALEMSIMELFESEGYTYVSGDQIHRKRTEVLLTEDLKQYLYNRYAKDGITPGEVDSVILMLRNISGTIYEANKAVYKLLCDGFILNREDRTLKDLYIELIDFAIPENNIFKVVNQFEIEGINNQLRIPDGIVFVNGIPVVVLEFKSAVKENTTIMDAYKQLTVRYRRDIPEIFKYNAFIVISEGANNKYGSFFSPYDFFYAWRKINADDTQQLLTDRTNVICISDEAHRSQINLDQKVRITESGVQRTYGFAKYLHDSLPNAAYVGFTGTPVDGTIEVFGGVVDAYTMTEAVRDGITVNLVYDGRAAKVMLDQEKVR